MQKEKKGNEMKEDVVNHPLHYATSMQSVQPECIDFAKKMTFCQGNAFKYIWRAGHKENILEDLEKALWYIDQCMKLYFATQEMEDWKYVYEKIRYTNTSGELEYRIEALNCIARQDYRNAVLCINEWKKKIKALLYDKK